MHVTGSRERQPMSTALRSTALPPLSFDLWPARSVGPWAGARDYTWQPERGSYELTACYSQLIAKSITASYSYLNNNWVLVPVSQLTG